MFASRSLLLLVTAFLCLLLLQACVLSGGEMPVAGARVGVLRDSFSPDYPARAETILRSLSQAGLSVEFISGNVLSDEDAFRNRRLDCLVLPDARFFPAGACATLLTFLRSGGDLVVIGGPIFDRLLYPVDGGWYTKEEILRAVGPEKIALDLSKLNSRDWQHASSNPEVQSKLTISHPAEQRPAWAEFSVEDLPGWDTYGTRLPENAFPEEHDAVCFRASGDANTPSMILEFQEKDKSRWIAVVPLKPETQTHALPLEEFKYWRDSASPGRGGSGDRLNLSNAAFVVIGLARSHNPLPIGPHSFRLSSIGSARSPALESPSLPLLETLHPWYKTYTTDAIDRIGAVVSSFPLPRGTTALGRTEMVCPVWRSRGLGFRNLLPYRWIPILDGYDSRTRFRGTVASLLLNFEGEYPSSHWLQIGFRDGRVISRLDGTVGRLAADGIEKMRHNLFLRSAGTDRASYFEGEQVGLGCVLNSPAPPSWRARMRVWERREAKAVVPDLDRTVSLSRRSEASVNWRPPSGKGAAYRAEVQLLNERDQIADMLTQDFTVLRDSPAPPDEIVRVEGCDFVLKGRRWYPHGINYWPSNWGGREQGEFWQHWLSPALYDPAVAERDLALARELGINSVSIQLNSAEQIPAANDFLFRCGQSGIYVNLFLSGAHPLHPNFRLLTAFLRQGRFTGNPAIYAYDIAWEPHLGEEGERRRYDPPWQEWIEERYGGIENAEEDWKFKLRKENGGITTPTQDQILNPGRWNVMVAAYRRFLDDLISRGYREVTGKIREIDPTHLIGARSGYGGTGEVWVDPQMPFDLISGAKHLDFISPEGYGLSPDWARARAMGFTTLYGRYAGNGKPVFWAEFGQSVHPTYDEAALAQQRSIYESMYRLVLDSFAQGSAGWWFPGGYRLGENSDYGIVSPDMAPRPSAEMLARYSAAITRQGPVPAPEAWITIDRDVHPRGYSQIRKRHEGEYVRLRQEGKVVGLRTAATGTTSATVPDVAVGNVPFTGRNPHKYLNAEFNFVKLVLRDGEKVRVRKGEEVAVTKGQPVRLEVSLGNTGEPTWLAPRGERLRRGDVCLSCSVNGRDAGTFPIGRNVGRYGDCVLREMLISPALLGAMDVTLRLEAFQKARFGERFTFSLRPE